MPSLDRQNRGVDAETRVGRHPWRIVAGARLAGRIQEPRLRTVAGKVRGGWVQGVSINRVRAISTGARITAARADASVVASKDDSGDGEEMISRPPGTAEDEAGEEGSGSASTAQSKDRKNVVSEERSTLWMKVLFEPFHTPHAPSVCHRYDNTAVKEDVDFKAMVCGEEVLRDAPGRLLEEMLGVSGDGDLDTKLRRFILGVRGVLGDNGAVEVK